MMNKGPYDYMVENYNYRMYVKNGIVKEDQIFEGRNGMVLIEKTNYLEVENDRKEKVEKLKAQEELSKKIIGVWSQKKIKDLNDNPEKFYQEDQSTPKA